MIISARVCLEFPTGGTSWGNKTGHKIEFHNRRKLIKTKIRVKNCQATIVFAAACLLTGFPPGSPVVVAMLEQLYS